MPKNYKTVSTLTLPPPAPLKLRPNGAIQIYYYYFSLIIIIITFVKVIQIKLWPIFPGHGVYWHFTYIVTRRHRHGQVSNVYTDRERHNTRCHRQTDRQTQWLTDRRQYYQILKIVRNIKVPETKKQVRRLLSFFSYIAEYPRRNRPTNH